MFVIAQKITRHPHPLSKCKVQFKPFTPQPPNHAWSAEMIFPQHCSHCAMTMTNNQIKEKKNLIQLCKMENNFLNKIWLQSFDYEYSSLPRNKKSNSWICHTHDHNDHPNLISGWHRVVKDKGFQIDPKFQL